MSKNSTNKLARVLESLVASVCLLAACTGRLTVRFRAQHWTRSAGNTHVVRLADLSEDDKERFQKEHASRCPGLISINFYGDGKPTLAVVLSFDETHGAKTQLIVAHELQFFGQGGVDLRSASSGSVT